MQSDEKPLKRTQSKNAPPKSYKMTSTIHEKMLEKFTRTQNTNIKTRKTAKIKQTVKFNEKFTDIVGKRSVINLNSDFHNLPKYHLLEIYTKNEHLLVGSC